MTRRGFALPLVVMLIAVMGLMIGVMLTRQSSQRFSVQRQIDGYRAHHAGRGTQEVLDGWLRSVRDRGIGTLTDADGKALEITMPGGNIMSVYLSDGQALPLDPIAAGQDEPTARAIVELLAEAEGGIPQLRRVGPVQVSVNTASAAVLGAAASVASDGKHGEDFAQAVIAERGGGPIPPEDLDQIAQSVGVGPEVLPRLRALVTAEPGVWQVEARLEPGSGPDRRTRVFRGLAVLGGQRPTGGGAVGQIWARRSSIRDWREVDADRSTADTDPSAAPAGPVAR